MKKFIIILLSLLFVLCAYSTESFNRLNIDVPCTVKVFQADDYRVRVIGNNVNLEIKDSTLNITGEIKENEDVVILVYAPVNEEIVVDRRKFLVREK